MNQKSKKINPGSSKRNLKLVGSQVQFSEKHIPKKLEIRNNSANSNCSLKISTNTDTDNDNLSICSLSEISNSEFEKNFNEIPMQQPEIIDYLVTNDQDEEIISNENKHDNIESKNDMQLETISNYEIPEWKTISLPNSATDTGFSEDLESVNKNFNLVMLDEFLIQNHDYGVNDMNENEIINDKNCDEIPINFTSDESLKRIESLLDILESVDKNPNEQADNANTVINDAINNELNDSKYQEIFQYLDEISKNCSDVLTVNNNTPCSNVLSLDNIPKSEELAKLSVDELKSEIINLSLSIKEKNSAIDLLQKELNKIRKDVQKTTKDSDKVIKEKLKVQKNEFEMKLKRHEKQIDQLNCDKRQLENKIKTLEKELLILEEKYNANLKAVEHKFDVDLKKAKEMFEISERVKREKWMENKTRQIKDMTVKGIEPELNNLNARHQQELMNLRNLHKIEIEDLELNASRKTQQKCEQLKDELMTHQKVVMNEERALMQMQFEQKFELQKKCFEEEKAKIVEEYLMKINQVELKENTARLELENLLKEKDNEFHDRLETINRRFGNELKLVKESKEMEFEMWKNNFLKEYNMQISQNETKYREQYQKEKQLEIDELIKKFESENLHIKQQYEKINENRIKRIKEKYEKDISELEKSEEILKSKYNDLKNNAIFYEENILTMKSTIKRLQSELNCINAINEKLQSEKNRFKEIAKQESRSEVQKLQKEILSMRVEKDNEMKQLHERIKTAIKKKDDILLQLQNDNRNLIEKCSYLETMLEKQRKEYLLK